MKQILLFFFCLIFSVRVFGQGCLPGLTFFSSQQEIDDFLITNPNCTTIIGSLVIAGNDISNLQGLNKITQIEDLSIVRSPNLKSLAGLESLQSIKFDLHIVDNPNLSSMEGLENLTKISGLEISNCPVLQNLKGLENLKNLNGDLIVKKVPLITNLKELEGLEINTPGQPTEIDLSQNESLVDINFLNHIKYGIETLPLIYIVDNPNLETCNILRACEHFVYEKIRFRNNGVGCIDNESVFEKCKNLAIPSGNCFFNPLTVRKQSQIDKFEDIFSNCTNLQNDISVWIGRLDDDIRSLSALQNLKSIEGGLEITSYGKLNDYTIGFNSLEYIGTNFHGNFENYSSFERLKTIGNNFFIGTENFEGFEKLEEVGGQLRIYDEKSLTGLSSLKSIGELNCLHADSIENLTGIFEIEKIGHLNLENCESLNNINGIRNLKELESVSIINCPNLSSCALEIICNVIGSDLDTNSVIIERNGSNCSTEQEVFFQCDKGGKITYNTFYDINENKTQDPGELFISNIPVNVTPGNKQILATSEEQAKIYLPFGQYSISLGLNNASEWIQTTDNLSESISLEPGVNPAILNFGIKPKRLISKLNPTIVSAPLRCGEETAFDIIVKNLGTVFGEGTFWFEIDPRIKNFRSEIPFDTISSTHTLGWNFKNLHPGYEIKRRVYLEIPNPPEIDLGERLAFYSYINPIIVNGMPQSSESVYQHELEFRCSYDPNDKLVSPNYPVQVVEPLDTAYYSLFKDDLTYTVRFQNTGNDYAQNITIRDTLDENLDPSTLTILSSSHYEVLNTTIENDRFISFEFKDIFLPDSTTNFDGSQGYVAYLIRTKEGLAEKISINNTASIYFDSNPPIVTNTTENIMVSELPTSFVENIDNQLLISIFPNPTMGNIFIKGDNLKNAKITLTDLAGRILKQEKLNGRQEISLTKVSKGMFFLKVETEEGIAVKRVIKI